MLADVVACVWLSGHSIPRAVKLSAFHGRTSAGRTMEGVSADGGGMTISELQEAIRVLRAPPRSAQVGFASCGGATETIFFSVKCLEVLATA